MHPHTAIPLTALRLTTTSIDNSMIDAVASLQLALLTFSEDKDIDNICQLSQDIDPEIVWRLVRDFASAVSEYRFLVWLPLTQRAVGIICGVTAEQIPPVAPPAQAGVVPNFPASSTSQNRLDAAREFLRGLLCHQADLSPPRSRLAPFEISHFGGAIYYLCRLAAAFDSSFAQLGPFHPPQLTPLIAANPNSGRPALRRTKTIPRVTSDSLRYSGSRAAAGEMERILREEIDDVESLPHFNRVHFGTLSSVEECLTVYRWFQMGLRIVDLGGWTNFPRQGALEDHYGAWLVEVAAQIKKLLDCGERTLVNRGNFKPRDSTDDVRCDMSLLDDEIVPNMNEYKFGNMHVVGELKSASVAATQNDRADGLMSTTESQLAKYVRHIFRTQETRHFVIAFILAGPLMRVYQFDRLGLTSSDMFNVNQNPIRLIQTLIAFFRMDETQLGHDPTILWDGPADQPFLQRQRVLTLSTGARLEIERCLFRANSVSGRGTTCWLASCMWWNGKQEWLVVKDSWQFDCREHEGILFQKASELGCQNLANYRFHEMVGYNAQQHLRYQHQQPNREFRRIGFDYSGSTPLEKAGSAIKLLQALRAALEGHRSLYQEDILHRDISVGNIMVRTGPDAPHGFLIDLDLAVDMQRLPTLSPPPHMTGSPIFMGIRRLQLAETTLNSILQLERKLRASSNLQEQADLRKQIRRERADYDQVDDDSYASDLESFFWVLLWVSCNHNIQGDWIGQKLNDWALRATKHNLYAEKIALLETPDTLKGLLKAEDPNGTYADVYPCVLSLRKLFCERARASRDRYTAPELKDRGLDNGSLYLRMRAIIDRSLDSLMRK